MNPVADHLRAAQALINTPDTWCQGVYFTEEGARCADKAVITTAARRHISTTAMDRALLDVIDAGSLTVWNDAPGRTHAQVMAAFDRAIQHAETTPTPNPDTNP